MTDFAAHQPAASQSAPGERPHDPMAIPKPVLWAAGVLLLFTVTVSGVCRWTGHSHVVLPPTTVVASRDLKFADLSNGGIDITDAQTGRHVALIQPTTGGFLRGVMRGLVREHHLDGGTAGAAFRLTRWADGRLSIADPVGSTSIELEAFGATNEAAFASLLADEPATSEGAAGSDGTMPRER